MRDMSDIVFLSHALESMFRKKHFLQFFELRSDQDQQNYDDYMVNEVCPSHIYQEYENPYMYQCSENMTLFTYLSTNYFKTRNQYIQNPFKNETLLWGGIQFQSTLNSSSTDLPRDNSYVNFAYNIKNSYELPLSTMRQIDFEQTIEGFLYKKAKSHNRDNYHFLKKLLGLEKASSVEQFSKQTFTYDEPEYIANMTKGLRPIKIYDIKPQSSTYQFFTREVIITSPKISFDECELLIPKSQILRITNQHHKNQLLVKEFISNTPEISVFLPPGKQFPLRIPSYESLDIYIIYTSETLGLFEALYEIFFDQWIFVGTFNAFVIPNQYELEPIYMTDVLINEIIEIPLFMSNPLSNGDLTVQEIYSTDPYVQLQWPCGESIDQKYDLDNNALPPSPETYVKKEYLNIPQLGRNHIVNMIFSANQTQDYYAEIHIRTSEHDVIRVPLYFHVHSDFMRFSPSVVDFGLIPQNFETLKVQIHFRHRLKETLTIEDILIPVSDIRLDFMIIEAKQLAAKEPIKPYTDVFLGYVVVNPMREGILQQKLTVIAKGGKSNQTYRFDLPIIANVIPSSKLLQVTSESQIAQDVSLTSQPIVSINVSDYLIKQQQAKVLFTAPSFRPVVLQYPLILSNTFQVPIQIRGIINQNSELTITALPNINQDKYLTLQPGESIKFAQIEVYTKTLKVSQGIKFISILVNNTLIPAAVQIHDNNLLCVWLEDQQKPRFMFCNQAYDINFGNVAIGYPKTRKLNITNFNPESITIETVSKWSSDDLIIYAERLEDKNGNQVNLTTFDEKFPNKMTFMPLKRTKKMINFTIQPYQTVCIVFQVNSQVAKQKSGKVEFSIKGQTAKNINFNYTYSVIEGNITIAPQIIRFNPGYPGMVQTKSLIAISTFEIPIVIKLMPSTDVRIFAQFPLQNSGVIMPKNKSEVAIINFDPSKVSNNNQFHSLEHLILSQLPGLDFPNQQHVLNLIKNASPLSNSHVTLINNQVQMQTVQFNNLGMNQMNGGNQYQKHVITVQDLIDYREKQKVWERLGAQGKTEIDAMIQIETNVIQNMTVQVKAFLTKPSIIIEDIIDFETVQIGTMAMKNIKIVNPSEEPLILSLHISNEPFQKLLEQANCKSEDDTFDVNSRPLYGKETYFSIFCSSKIKEVEQSFKLQSQILIDDLEELIINSHQNQRDLCWRFHLLLTSKSYLLSETEQDLLKQHMESFYKELIQEQHISAQQPFQNVNIQSQFKNVIKINKDMKLQGGKDLLNGNYINLGSIAQQFEQNQAIQYPELDSIAGQINKVSTNRQIDQYTINQYKQFEKENAKGFFDNLMTLIRNRQSKIKDHNVTKTFKKEPFNIHNFHQNQGYNQAQYQKDLLSQKKFKLKNSLLNELIIQNDTSKFYIFDKLDNQTTNRPFVISNQSFYINPKIQGTQFRVDPKSNFTISQAIIFQPQSIFQENLQMNLIIKNNLTILHQVELKGKSGTGLIEFTSILKKSLNSESYVNVQNLQQSSFQDGIFDHENLNDMMTQKNIREKIISYIFGYTDNYLGFKLHSQVPRTLSEVEKVLYFTITAEDMISIHGENHQDLNSIDDYLHENSQNIKLNNQHKRIYVAVNNGNLPITIETISIDGLGCSAYGLRIENCHQFTLRPGETYQISIVYITDYTIGKIRKPLVLESKYFTQEFVIQVTLPMNLLPMANQLQSLTPYQESLNLIIKLLILAVGFFGLLFISKDIVSHFKFKQDQLQQEKIDAQIQQELYFMQNQPIKPRDIPVVRDCILHEQVYSVFQAAQDKFESPNQLLLKEISNICSKKNLVCLEAQKQALDAMQRRKNNNRQNFRESITVNKYLERKDKEEIQYQKAFESLIAQSPIIQKHPEVKQQASSSPPYTEEIGARRNQLQHQESRDSNQTDMSVTEFSADLNISAKKDSSSNVIPQKEKVTSVVKEDKKENTIEIEKVADTSMTSDQKKEEIKANEALREKQYQQKIQRISKKQNKETAKRIKEQQEMEERFRQLQLKKEQEEAAKKKQKEQDDKRAKELARIAEEQLKAHKLEMERLAAKKQEELEKAAESAENSAYQSQQEAKDTTSLNLSQAAISSQVDDKESNHQNNQEEDREFKRNLEYIGDLDQPRASFLSEQPERKDMLTGSEINQSEQKSKSSHQDRSDNEKEVKVEIVPEKEISIQKQVQQSSEPKVQEQRKNQNSDVQQKRYDRNSYISREFIVDSSAQQYQSQQKVQSVEKTYSKPQAQEIPEKTGFRPKPYQQESFQSQNQHFKGAQQHYGYSQVKQQGTYVPSKRQNQYQNNEEEDEDDYYSQRYQQTQQVSNERQNQVTSVRRVTYVPISQTQSTRGRGRTQTYYKSGQEYQEDYTYEQSYQGYNKSYTKTNEYRQYDDYGDEYYKEDGTYYKPKSQYTSKRAAEHQDDYLRDEYGEEYDTSLKEETKSFHNQHYDRNYNVVQKKKPSETTSQPTSQQRPVYFRNPKSKDKYVEEDKSQSNTQRLSKDELKPFIDSQKKQDVQKTISSVYKQSSNSPSKDQDLASKQSKLVSPSSNVGGSIFSFNPLNLFTQGSQAKQGQNDQTKRKETSISEKEIQHNVAQIVENDTDEDNQEEDKSLDSQFGTSTNMQANKNESVANASNTDFYNAFKSASSLFSKPLFGATTVSRQNDARIFQPPTNQYQHQDQEDESDNNNEDEGDEGSSLFSGSLFGDSGPFSQQRKSQNNLNQEVHQQKQHHDEQINLRGYYSGQGIRAQVPPQANNAQFFPPPGLSIQGQTGAPYQQRAQVYNYQPYYQQHQQQQHQQQQQQQMPNSLFGGGYGNMGYAHGIPFGSYLGGNQAFPMANQPRAQVPNQQQQNPQKQSFDDDDSQN